MKNKKLCNNCKFFNIKFNGIYRYDCKKKIFENKLYSNPILSTPQIEKPKICKYFKLISKKKQQYIYVARDKGYYKLSNRKMIIDKFGNFHSKKWLHFSFGEIKDLLKLKLKKGEQVCIPIDIDKAEIVR